MGNSDELLRELVAVLRTLRSPGGCPWDGEQTHQSLRRYFIEEVYEAVEAIDENDPAHLREELGDVLWQIIFHAQLAEEAGQFTLDDVIRDVTEKMKRRHPQVFSGAQERLSWDEVKRQERGDRPKSLLEGVGVGLPALLRAQKLQEQAGKVGFDWTMVESIWQKIDEEIDEFKAAIAEKDDENMENEAGDMLFALINLLRWYKISGENALNRTNTKFYRRFSHVERRVMESGKPWDAFSIAQLDAFWDEAKVQEKLISER